MNLGDARRLDQRTQEALRQRAVRLVIAEGKTHGEVAAAIGVARGTVSRWVSAFQRGGAEVLERKRRGRRKEEQKILTPREALQIQGWVRDRCPDQLKLPFMLWTTRAVQQLIAAQFRKRLALSTVQLYLRRWGFTPQKPLFKARERNNAAIERWLNEEYPRIAARAKAEGASILWGDETGISNQDQIGRSYAPKGKTPVLNRTAKRFTTSMITAISNRGELKFMIYQGALNVALFLKFLNRLIRNAPKKIFLILDNLKVHHAHAVQEWLEQPDIKEKISLFFLPSYTPEYNPDEYFNNDLKQQLNNTLRPANAVQMLRSIRHVTKTIQNDKNRVASYFRAPHVAYAA